MKRRFLSGLGLILLPFSFLSGVVRADLTFEGKITLDDAAPKAEPGELDLFAGKVSLEASEENLEKLPAIQKAKEELKEAARKAPGEERLPEDLREKWRSFFNKSRSMYRTYVYSELSKEQKALTELAKLDEAGVKRLNAVGEAVLEANLKTWENWFAEKVLAKFELSGEAAILLERMNPTDTVYTVEPPEEMQPLKSAQWKEGIKPLVSEEILTNQAKDREALRVRVMDQMEDKLVQWEEQARSFFESNIRLKLDELTQFSTIGEEKLTALNAAVMEAAKLSTQLWRERCIRMMLASTDAERQNHTIQESPPLLMAQGLGQMTEYQDVWLKAKKEMISAEDLAKVEEGRARMRSVREQVLARLTLAEMEKAIGFRPAQREALLMEAYKQMKDLSANFYDRGQNNYYSIDLNELLTRIKKIPDDVVKKILTEPQMKRWTELTVDQLSEDRFSYRRSMEKPDDKDKAPADLDEAGAQQLIGQLLEQEAEKYRKTAWSRMEAQADLVIASASAAPPVADQIRTAAKGSSETVARGAIAQLEQHILSQFRNIKPGEVPKRLKNLSIPSGFSRSTEAEPALWTASLKRLLTEEQQNNWKAEQKEQASWLRSCVSSLLVTEIAKTVVLSPEKSEALQTKMDELMEQYGEDIMSIFSRKWYLQGYYGPIPLALLTDKELGEYFTPAQLDGMRSGALGRAGQYSQMIKQRHKQRTKTK